MSLKVKDLKSLMECIAPVNLKEDYDNVGLMVGSLEKEVSNILIALDCTIKVIEEAKAKNCNFIITHHPLLFTKPSSVTDETLLGKKINKLIKNDISLYSAHTNLDSVKGGLNDILTKLLGYENASIMEVNNRNNNLGEDGIGRLVSLTTPCTLFEICTNVKEKLEIDCLKYIGEVTKLIKKIAIINGSGEDFYKTALSLDADLIITGDTKYHNSSDIYEMGLSIIDAGHFETEWPAMKIFGDKIKGELIKAGFSNNLIISESSKPVYKFM